LGQELPKKIEQKENFLLDTAEFQDAFEETDDSVALYVFPRKTITVGINKGQIITEELNVISQFNNFIVYEYDNIGSDQVKLDRFQFIFSNIESTITRLQSVLDQIETSIANGNSSIVQELPQETQNYPRELSQDFQGAPDQFQETLEQTQSSLSPTVFLINNLYNTAKGILGADNSIVNNIYYFLEDNYPQFGGIFLSSLKKNIPNEVFADIISKM
jgi:paraquat-inducible protein B